MGLEGLTDRADRFCRMCGQPLEGGVCRRGHILERIEDSHDTGPVNEPVGALSGSATKQLPPTPPYTPDPDGHDPVSGSIDAPRPKKHNVSLTTVLGVILVVAIVALTSSNLSLKSQVSDSKEAADRTADRISSLERSTKRAGERNRAISGALTSLEGRVNKVESAAERAPSTTKLAATAQKSVFTVETDESLGTAWVIRSDSSSSTLVTNHHVVEPLAVGASVRVKQEDLTFPATITYVNEADDLAMVKVDHPFPALRVALSKPTVGSPVVIIGSPLGLGGSVTTGVVSAIRTEQGTPYVQFSAPISPGNSGGPVLNEQGAVIGVAVSKYVDMRAEGLGFAIPTDVLCGDTHMCT